MTFTEANYENALVALFEEDLGYEHIYGPDVDRDFRSPLYEERLHESLQRINPELPEEALKEAVYRIRNYESRNLIHQNIQFTKYLQCGVEVNYVQGGKKKSALVRLVDFAVPENNDFVIANQWTVQDNETRRPDLIVFLNGLPLVVAELKSCSREDTDSSAAFRQLRNYTHDISSLFIYNAFMIISDLSVSKAGTITATTEERYMEWKTVDGSYEDTRHAAYDTLFKGMFEKRRFLDILQNFLLYSRSTDADIKILAGYHQYFAVRKAVESTRKAVGSSGEDAGKAGVVWHTTGSGKSLAMVFYAQLLQSALDNPTVVVLTDRNDLDDQLYTQFDKCKDFLRQTPERAESRGNLKKLLAGRRANGIFFTTMQKFEQYDEPLSDRRDIILIADEAHRSQYSTEKVDSKTGAVKLGFARLVRDSMPRATFIGFTGTPISEKDRSTRDVFGSYIDVYDMTQSVEDGATRPVYYESRVIKLGLDESILEKIDDTYDRLSENADDETIEKSKKQLAQMESVLGADQTIRSLCEDIVEHYEQRQDLLTGKAMIVAYSRPIAVKILHSILDIRPEWQEKIRLVMTSDNNDPEDWKKLVGSKADRKELARKFKDDEDEMKIALVVDMWLTGFDVPSLATMYVYKPMAGYNLMQAIARVNRVYKDKEGGLVVDYVGIASALKRAMKDYTVRDRDKYGDTDVSKDAFQKFLEKLEVCRDLFHELDYSKFMDGTDKDRADLIVAGINFVLEVAPDKKPEDKTKQELFAKEAMLLRQAHSLCRSLPDKTQRFEAAYFEAIRTAISRLAPGRKLSLKEINSQVNELLKHSIKSDGIVNLFADTQEEVSLFDQKFLREISLMKQKNLAAELLAKLLKEQIQVYRRTNLVQSTVFSEKMKELMNKYHNGHITNAKVIEELLDMAHAMQKEHSAGNDLGLSVEEKAFYDAITRPEAIRDFYDNETLIAMTQELTELLRNNRTIDWQKKETARADMRSIVRRLLKTKYKYPPDGLEGATDLVMAQCEMWADNEDMPDDSIITERQFDTSFSEAGGGITLWQNN